jgi:hypothetical protein
VEETGQYANRSAGLALALRRLRRTPEPLWLVVGEDANPFKLKANRVRPRPWSGLPQSRKPSHP